MKSERCYDIPEKRQALVPVDASTTRLAAVLAPRVFFLRCVHRVGFFAVKQHTADKSAR